jgi:spermidine synthase
VAADYDARLAAGGFVDRDTTYNRVIVFKGADDYTGRLVRVMSTGPGAKQSAMYLDDPSALVLPYTRFFRLAEHFVPEMKRMLVLGGGGFSFPKYALAHYPDVRVDVVELDPGVTALAREHFELKDHPRQRIVAEDARTFLNRNRETYDAILCDTFNSHYAIPFHLTTLEAVQRMHSALAPNGVVLVNLISALKGERGRLFDAMFATYTRVFPRVLAFAVRNPRDGTSWQNVMLAAFTAPDEPLLADPDPDIAAMLAKRLDIPVRAGVAPLTDDYAPVDRYIMSAW